MDARKLSASAQAKYAICSIHERYTVEQDANQTSNIEDFPGELTIYGTKLMNFNKQFINKESLNRGLCQVAVLHKIMNSTVYNTYIRLLPTRDLTRFLFFMYPRPGFKKTIFWKCDRFFS